MTDTQCAACGAARTQPGNECEACHAPPAWQDLFRAGHVADEQCDALLARGLLTVTERARVADHLSLMRTAWAEQMRQGRQPPSDSGLPTQLICRQCHRPANAGQHFCATCGGATADNADALRHLDFVVHLIAYRAAVDLPPDTVERCVAALRARIGQIESDLKQSAAVQAIDEPAVAARPGRRTLFEILLDPQSIRWLLVSGGVLLTVGLVIFLSSLGVFENAKVVAAAMGAGTLAVLGGGIGVIRLTRHNLAGRAMALLGCLVMPLNLWFYHANGLVTLDGHLWLAALACCVLYAAAAVTLRDPLFVYVLFGGIAMTGMLALADVHRLVEISAPATLLIALGLVSLHAERAFADDDGPFSRKRFGLACFRSAHALIGLGLVLLLGSQIATWMPDAGFGLNHVAALPSNAWLSLALVLAGGYGYVYSSLVVRRSSVGEHAAMLCLLWAELLGLQLAYAGHQISASTYSLAIATAGAVGLIVHRFINVGRTLEDRRAGGLFNGANAMLSLPIAGVMLLTVSRLATGTMERSLLWTPAWLGGLALVAAMVSARGVRRWYLALTISQVILCMVTLAHYSTLGLPRKLELISVFIGLVLLCVGYVHWYRTQDGRDEGAGLSLLFGALLAGLPPAGFALVNRFGYDVSFVDELSLVTIAVLMFLTGMMARVRATTLVGGGLLVCHLLTLIVFAGMKAQLAVGVYVSIGGALLFAAGVVLSVNRERLLNMPRRIRERQGLFRVLAWR